MSKSVWVLVAHLVLVTTALSSTVSCGLKGDLYLPNEKPVSEVNDVNNSQGVENTEGEEGAANNSSDEEANQKGRLKATDAANTDTPSVKQ